MQNENPYPVMGMPLPDQFTYGQLFACSGLDRDNLHLRDWSGVLTDTSGEIRFFGDEHQPPVLLRFTERDGGYDAVLSDLILADDGGVVVAFADAQTVVGRTDGMPSMRSENGPYVSCEAALADGSYGFALFSRKQDDGYRFAFCRRETVQAAQQAAREAIDADVDALAAAVLDWYCCLPLCPEPRYAKLWYKCLSVNRVNVYSPQDGIDCRFTTPNRLHNRHVRMLDSCFHALALAHFDPLLAKEAVEAVLQCRGEDGFLPHHIRNSTEVSDITHPPMLCMTVWYLFEAAGDVSLLQDTVDILEAYLEWNLANRRAPSGLMMWHTQPCGADRSLCEECDMDSSPRFDTTEPLEALDFSVLMMYEMKGMRRIRAAMGDMADAMRWDAKAREMAELIDSRLWDAKDNCYYDRTSDGEFRRILTPVSFLPMYAELCDPRRARMLAARIESLMQCAFPLPSAVDRDGGYYTREQWRGGVWLQYNFFVYLGLLRYGYGAEARELRRKTLEGVNKQFEAGGNIFEFYDPLGGDPQQLGSIPDFNRSACLIQMFLRG